MPNPWNDNALKRHNQILDGRDFSFDNVLLPTFMKLINKGQGIKIRRVLDIGCGSGILTNRLSKYVENIIGIDPSTKSIDIAKQAYQKANKIEFYCTSIDNFKHGDNFDVVISNMSIQTIKNLKQALTSTLRLMNKSGVFIFSLPHPCFWIEYRKKIGLDEYPNYRYMKNSGFQITFSISNDRTPLPSYVPLYHRPIEHYITQLREAGFSIENMLEPLPKKIAKTRANWETPHFLFFVCSKE